MPRFLKLLTLVFMLLLAGSPLSLAHAQGNSGHDKENGNGNSHSDSSGDDQSGNSDDHGNHGGNGNGSGHGSGNENGNGNGNGNGDSARTKPGKSNKQEDVVPSSTQAAPAVAQEGITVKLETIYDAVHATAKGEIIDAQLVTVQGFLLYEIKLLEDDGLVRNVYYYAKSGKPVATR